MTSEPIRVLEIIKGLDIGGINGGAERFGADLSIAFAQKGISVELAVFFQTNTIAEQEWMRKLKEAGVHIVPLSTWKGNTRIEEFIKGCFTLASYQKNRKFNIIHSHTQFGTLAALCTKALYPDVKVVRTAHVTQEWGNSIYSKIQKFIWGNLVFPITTDAQVAVSNAVLQSIRKYIGQKFTKNELLLIYNAIPVTRTQIEITRNQENLIVGTAARLTEQKGINYLIEAASIVCQQLPQVKFLIAGEGELKEDFQKLIHQRKLSDCVFLTGKYIKAHEFLSKLDLFVLPSLWEGLPTVILESMAYGIPVIATNIPGTNEIIQDGVDGWLVPPKNSAALAEKIIFALRSPYLREKIIQEGYKKVELFSMDRIAEKYLGLFRQLLLQNGSN